MFSPKLSTDVSKISLSRCLQLFFITMVLLLNLAAVSQARHSPPDLLLSDHFIESLRNLSSHDSFTTLPKVNDNNITLKTGHVDLSETSDVGISPFNPNDWYEWINFPNDNERNAVLSAMIGTVPMIMHTIKALTANPNHPSFLRYFNTGDINIVLSIYHYILAVLGGADSEELRSCLRVNKLQIWFGDGPGRNLCATTGAYAYTWNYDDSFGVTRYYISYCPPFFLVYQKYDFVPCSKIGPSSDPGDEGIGTIWSASLAALHEMLHWSELTIEVAQLEIEDLKLTRPDTGQITIAYRPFYSMRVKDWGAGKRPTTNADNYVFTVAECFYSFLCPQLPAWQDPPDPVRVWTR